MSALYVHLPFCRVRCSYCPFAISTDGGLEEAYIGALLKEIQQRADGGEATTIYFGGGTPSRTSQASLRRVMAALRSAFHVSDDAEISLEANPEDVTASALDGWRDLGVNRLSIGVQSFEDAELQEIGRVHDAAAASSAVDLAVRSGIRTNLDLIAGLPGQTDDRFESGLRRAIARGAGHLSLYMLDLDEPTVLRGRVEAGIATVPPEESVATMYATAVEILEASGLRQYEISNFALPGEESRHNLAYWLRRPYHGFGLAAHSFDGRQRFANTRNISDYITRPADAIVFREALTEDEERRERLFLGLRQTRGLHYAELVDLCGQEGEQWIGRGLHEGWLRRCGESVAFTTSGFLLSSSFIAELF